MLKRIIGIYIFLSLCLSPTFAQKGGSVSGTKSELQTKREALLKEIANAQALLNDAKMNQKVTLTQLNAINKKLALRRQLINNINQEIKSIGTDINTTNREITILNQKLAKYRMEYARSVRYAYKNKESQNMMVFVFSADNFNEMMRRMEYMKKYRQYRTVQANRIREISATLKKSVDHLNNRKLQRNSLLSDEEQHEKAIQTEADQTTRVAQELKGQVTDLSSQIAKNKKAAAQLDNAIRVQIQKEIAEARRIAAAEAEKRRLEEEMKRKQKEAEEQLVINRQKAIEEEQRRAAELEKQAAIARQKANEAAEKQRLQDLADAKRRREEAAAEEKRIADQKSREEQKKRNEERNREIDRKKEEERQKEIARQKKLAEDLEKQKAAADKNVEQYKSGATVVTINKNPSIASSGSSSGSSNSSPSSEQKNYKNMLPQDAQNLSASFEANRGSLPWPVDRGLIVAPYGQYQHPLEKSVTLNNEGIDIGTNTNAPVKAVFGGVVTKIFNVPGMGVSVLINHGSYYTLYSKLSSASVSAGTKVSTRQVVGTAGVNDFGDNVVHFELWKVNDNGSFNTVNPTSWIAPR